MLVKNKEELVQGEFKKIRSDFLDCYDAVLSEDFFGTWFKENEIDISEYKRIFFIGVGKSAGKFASGLSQRVLVDDGLVICKDGEYFGLENIEVFYSSHPHITKKSFEAYEKIVEFKKKNNLVEGDLVLFFVSGGASALVECLKDGIDIEEYMEFSKKLLCSGLNINELNIIRKSLSKIKAGGILSQLNPAKVLGFIESDVLEGELNVVGSGLTFPDSKNYYSLARKIIEKRFLKDILPNSIKEFFYERKEFNIDLRRGDNLLENRLVFDNKSVLNKIKSFFCTRGYQAEIISTLVNGDLQKFCEKLILNISDGKYEKNKILIFGSELTLNIPSDRLKFAKGGRNQHFAALFLKYAKEYFLKKDFVVASFATDGSDFLDGIAGGIVDSGTSIQILADKLDSYRSYDFLKETNNLIKTNSTGMNVCDVILIYLK